MTSEFEAFKNIFTNETEALGMGVKLRQLIFDSLSDIEESIIGGSKVKLALYSRNGNNNVLCGIQEGKEDTCLLYVHHINTLSHERLKFSGRGKHAKRIRFHDESEIVPDDITWLLSLVNQNAPY